MDLWELEDPLTLISYLSKRGQGSPRPLVPSSKSGPCRCGGGLGTAFLGGCVSHDGSTMIPILTLGSSPRRDFHGLENCMMNSDEHVEVAGSPLS